MDIREPSARLYCQKQNIYLR